MAGRKRPGFRWSPWLISSARINHFGGHLTGGGGPGSQAGLDLALGVEMAAGDGRDEDRRGPGLAKGVDVDLQVVAVGGGRVGLALGALAGLVVVAELDEDEIGPSRGRQVPFRRLALGAAATGGEVKDLHPSR